MEEIWKDIQGYEGLYQVSNLGNIKSLHYGPKNNIHNLEALKPRILKSRVATTGYYRVELYKPGSRKNFYIHSLVAKAFIPNPLNKPEVNHIDGNKLNNCVENLEWVTKSENQLHAIAHGLRAPSPMTGRTGKLNPRSRPVIQYDLNGNFIKIWDCGMSASKALGISTSVIYFNASGKTKTSKKFLWRYLENHDNPTIPIQL